jgi:hypothetical protein
MRIEREAIPILNMESIVEMIMRDERAKKEQASSPCITFTRSTFGDLTAFLRRPATTSWVPITTA